MRSRLAFKKVGPEDWGLRQKASQVYARGGLAGTGKPTTRLQRSTRTYSGRAPPNEKGELRTRRAETGAVLVGHGAASEVPAGDNIRYAPPGASRLRLREAHATCQGFGVAVILEVAVAI